MNLRILLKASALVAILLCAITAYSQLGKAPQGPRVVSPEILSDKKVTFRLLAPKAGTVVLNGNWDNGTNIQMTKDDQGIWSVTVEPLGEQLWGYSFNVDGVKVLDPGNGEVSARRQPLQQSAVVLGSGFRFVGF
jgi:enterochelin esterase family protein